LVATSSITLVSIRFISAIHSGDSFGPAHTLKIIGLVCNPFCPIQGRFVNKHSIGCGRQRFNGKTVYMLYTQRDQATRTLRVTPSQLYQLRKRECALSADPQQELVIQQFDRLYGELLASTGKTSLWDKWGRKLLGQPWSSSGTMHSPVRGIYLWGGVGRGKTMLMDIFYESLPGSKQRLHFHHFMQNVHAALKKLGGIENPLNRVAMDIARNRVLCLDEFIVTDITDAMLLSGLLQALFARGVCLVTTSNTAPDNLYRDGLQRARFLPAIELLKQHTEVLQLDNNIDYRLQTFRRDGTYHYPLDGNAIQHMQNIFQNLASGGRRQAGGIEINGRRIPVVGIADSAIWFEFAALCDAPRSQNDYLEIARLHHTVLLSGVPQMDDMANDAARRFLNLLDVFYDHRVNLIVSAAVDIPNLYQGQRLAFEFERAQSRLLEMQSEQYLMHGHLS
jgi:cell division protein ZapE